MVTDRNLFGSLGRALRELRGDRPQRIMAYGADVSIGSWNAWEAGKRLPRDSQFAKILESLGCSEEDLKATIWRLLGEELKSKGSELTPVALATLAQDPSKRTSVQFRSVHEDYLPAILRLEERLIGIEADFEALIVLLESWKYGN